MSRLKEYRNDVVWTPHPHLILWIEEYDYIDLRWHVVRPEVRWRWVCICKAVGKPAYTEKLARADSDAHIKMQLVRSTRS